MHGARGYGDYSVQNNVGKKLKKVSAIREVQHSGKKPHNARAVGLSGAWSTGMYCMAKQQRRRRVESSQFLSTQLQFKKKNLSLQSTNT